MRIRIVERGTIVEISGTAKDVFEALSLIPDISDRITLCVNGGNASACWAAS
jgi:hypothetical protein